MFQKSLRFVPMLSVLLCLLLLHALCVPAAAYDAQTVLPAHPLSAAEQQLRDLLYPALLAQQTEISLPAGTSYDMARQAMEGMMCDYPELFPVDDTYTITYTRAEPDVARSIRPTYRCTLEEAESLRTQLLSIAQVWANETPDVLSLHDRLLAQTTYATDTRWYATAIGALLDGKANCQGYAHALTLLCRTAGYPVMHITGVATDHTGVTQRHSWNLVQDEAGAFLVDATWNDQGAYNTHWYYGLSEEAMALDHTPDAGFQLPDTSGALPYLVQQGAFVTTEAELAPFLRQLAHGETINLLLSDDLYQRCISDFNSILTHYNDAAAPQDAFSGSYSILFSDIRRTLLIFCPR